MDIKELAQGRLILWGANWSYYTGKARACLIKKGIPHVEVNPSHPHFQTVTLPQIGHFTLPVLETPDGRIVADSTEIIEYLEEQYPEPSMIPEDPVMAALAWQLHNWAAEGLLRHGVHTRWITTQDNIDFIVDEFTRATTTLEQRRTGAADDQPDQAEYTKNYLPLLGISEENEPLTQGYLDALYPLLNAHFMEYPYLLGGSPSIADCGLMAPLYGHLARDVTTSNALKKQAPALYRWAETMGRVQEADSELWYVPSGFFAPGELPPTLTAILSFMADYYGPTLQATADTFHAWLPGKEAGAIISEDGQKANRQLMADMEHAEIGGSVRRRAILDLLPLHQRVSAAVAKMSDAQKASYEEILRGVGGDVLIDLRLERGIVRSDFTYVLA